MAVGGGGDFVLEVAIPQEELGAVVDPGTSGNDRGISSATLGNDRGTSSAVPGNERGTSSAAIGNERGTSSTEAENQVAGIRIVRPSIVLNASPWNPVRPEGMEFWMPPHPLNYQRMTQEEAQELRAGLEAGGMLDMPSDEVLPNFWARLVGNVRVPFASLEEECRYRPWAAYLKFIWRRSGAVLTRIIVWVLSMVPESDPFRYLGRLAPHRLAADEQAELTRAREIDAARYARYRQNNSPSQVAAQQWQPKVLWDSSSSSSLNSPACSLLPSPSSSVASFPLPPSSLAAAPPLPHVPPPPPPPRNRSVLPPSLPSPSLPPPTRPRLQSLVRVVRPPREDPFAPTPIAVCEAEIRAAAEGAEAAMNWRHDRVMGELLRFNRTEAAEREAKVRATMSPATIDYMNKLEKQRRDKGKSFPTYASDRKPRPKNYRTTYSEQDVRSRFPPEAPSSSKSGRQAGMERYILPIFMLM